ncbi:MAG: hypothetical protein K2X47_19515 [Bdellovibrionales bacterium]|nr:hypothetical protein [Bdellovibrionales bacterium]
MTWAPYAPEAHRRLLNGRPHPKVWMFLGAHDPEICLADQRRVVEAYSRAHPELDITAIATAAGHNPAGPAKFKNAKNEEVKIPAMKIMNPFLEDLRATVGFPQIPGLKLEVHSSLNGYGICPLIAQGFSPAP